MRENVAQMVLLVRAFEEADRDGVVLSQEQRLAASRRAVMVTTRQDGGETVAPIAGIGHEETIIRRARLLFNALSRRVPHLQRVLASHAAGGKGGLTASEPYRRSLSHVGSGTALLSFFLNIHCSLVG